MLNIFFSIIESLKIFSQSGNNTMQTKSDNTKILNNNNNQIREELKESSTTVSSVKKEDVGKQKFEIELKEIKGAKYQQGGRFKSTPKWIVVHYTAVIGASAKSCATSYSKSTKAVSTHFFCDSKEIYRVVDEKHIAWHVGDGQPVQPIKDKKLTLEELVQYGDKANWRFKLASENHLKWKEQNQDCFGNKESFGVDICTLKKDKTTTSVKDEDWFFNEDAVLNAEKCVAFLCNKYKIDLDHVVRHADLTGKPCPRPFVSLSGDKDKTKNDNNWIKFKENVKSILENSLF